MYSSIYCFYYLGMALLSGIISIYLQDMGFHLSQISLCTNAGLILTMILQPFAGYLADRFSIKRVCGTVLLMAAVSGAVFARSKATWIMIVFYGVAYASIFCINPMIEEIVLYSPYSYGPIRSWGTIGYAVGMLILQVLYQHISPNAAYYGFALSELICMGAINMVDFHKEGIPQKNEKHSFQFSGNYLIYVGIFALICACQTAKGTYLPIVLRERGVKLGTITTVISLSVIAQLPVVFYGKRFVEPLSTQKLLIMAILLQLVQYVLLAFSHSQAVLNVMTVLVSATSAMLMIIINLEITQRMIPEAYQSTALSVTASLSSLLSIGLGFIVGTMMEAISIQSAFTMMSCLAVAALAVAMLKKM